MQYTKNTKNFDEFQKFIDSNNKTGLCLEDTLKFFDIQGVFGQFESVKQSGIKLIFSYILLKLYMKYPNIEFRLLFYPTRDPKERPYRG